MGPDALDLGAAQHEAGLKGVLDAVVVTRSSVLGDRLAHGGTPLVAPCGPAGSGGPGHPPDARTPARFRTGVLNATDHPAGTDSRGRPPPRWCSNYNCRSLHITSFRSLTTIPGCRDPGQASISQQPRTRPLRRQRLPVACTPSTSSAASMAGSSPPREPAVGSTTTSGTMPVPLIHTLSGVSHLAVVSRKPPWSSSSCVHSLDGSLAEGRGPRASRGPGRGARRRRSRTRTRTRRR